MNWCRKCGTEYPSEQMSFAPVLGFICEQCNRKEASDERKESKAVEKVGEGTDRTDQQQRVAQNQAGVQPSPSQRESG